MAERPTSLTGGWQGYYEDIPAVHLDTGEAGRLARYAVALEAERDSLARRVAGLEEERQSVREAFLAWFEAMGEDLSGEGSSDE